MWKYTTFVGRYPEDLFVDELITGNGYLISAAGTARASRCSGTMRPERLFQ
jgi:hypothetical protein